MHAVVQQLRKSHDEFLCVVQLPVALQHQELKGKEPVGMSVQGGEENRHHADEENEDHGGPGDYLNDVVAFFYNVIEMLFHFFDCLVRAIHC